MTVRFDGLRHDLSDEFDGSVSVASQLKEQLGICVRLDQVVYSLIVLDE